MSLPDQYRSTFELFADGVAVMDDLQAKFGGPLWADSADERTRRIGQREVIEYMLLMIARAQAPIPTQGP